MTGNPGADGMETIAVGTAPWIPARHRMELLRSSEQPQPSELTTAAFVLVFDPSGLILLTRVNLPGRGWDVPGGHIDPGEDAEDAALREVEEETGLVLERRALRLVGCQRFTLLEAPPADYPYPRPLSYTLMFTARTAQAVPPVQPLPGSECGPAEWCTMDEVAARCARASWLPFVTVAAGLG